MTTRDLLLSKRLPGNALDQQAASRRALTELANRDISVPQLSGIATDFGLINAGTIVMGNGQPLGAGFTGMMRFADALEWPAGSGKSWTDIAFNNDVMTFGISALDGKLYAAAGALFVDMTGVSTTGLDYFWNMQATFNSNTNYAKTGMFVPYNAYGGSPEPAWQTTFQTSAGSNLATNGGFETSDFTGWTTTTAGGASWAVVTGSPTPQAGTYCAKMTSGSGKSGTIAPTNRIAVSPLQPYEFVAYLSFAGGQSPWAGTTQTIRIDFYDNTVGGNLLDTFTYYLPVAYSGAWAKFWKILTSPANAAAVTLTISFGAPAGLGGLACVVDSVSVKNIQSYSQASMQPEFTIDGSGVNLEELQEDSSALPTIQQPAPGFGHLYARRKTHGLALFRSYGDELDVVMGKNSTSYNLALSTTPVTLVTDTIKGGAMGIAGVIHTIIAGFIINTSGANKTYTQTFSFGTYSKAFTTPSIGSSGTIHIAYMYEIWMYNDQATGTQQVIYHIVRSTAGTAGALAAPSADTWGWDTCTQDTSTDTVLSWAMTSSANGATQTVTGMAAIGGPTYG